MVVVSLGRTDDDAGQVLGPLLDVDLHKTPAYALALKRLMGLGLTEDEAGELLKT